MDISQILRALRKNAKMNIHVFVKKSGISRAWVYKLEKGDVPSPSVAIIRKWVQASKPMEVQQQEMAEWYRLGMLIIFDGNELPEKKSADAMDVDAMKSTEDKPKNGWLSRVLKSTLTKSK
jgi:transcriptional regulator with XRE-family HTH domain